MLELAIYHNGAYSVASMRLPNIDSAASVAGSPARIPLRERAGTSC